MVGLFADPKVNGLVTNPGLFITDGGGELLGTRRWPRS